MRQLRSKILLFNAVFILSLFFLEVFFRLALPQEPFAFPNNLKRGRFTKEGTYQNKTMEFKATVIVNKEGFVDSPWEDTAKPVVFLVGDSFVQAAQVNLEDGWGRKLQSLFQKDAFDPQIISFGIPGAGIATEFELIKQYAPQLKPKIIYLSFLVDNDIFNNHSQLEAKQDKPFYILQDNRLVLHWESSSHQKNILLQNFHLARWLQQNLWLKKEQKRRITLGNGVPLNFYVHQNPPSPIWEEAWMITQKAFEDLSNYCHKNDIDLKIVLTPAHWQISRTKTQQLKSQFPQMSNWDIENYAYQRSERMLKELNVTTIDLYADFRSHPDPDLLYYPIDAHWTKEGHALAAEILYTNWKDSASND